MSLLPIIDYPNKLLKERAEPVQEVDDEIRQLLDDMVETMVNAKGLGLSGNQVGVLKRVIVVNDERNYLQMVNPQIIKSSSVINSTEGCLSFANITIERPRHFYATVKYLDRDGNKKTLDTLGVTAVCIQHEIDHLDGITFVDGLSATSRALLLSRVKKAIKKRDRGAK